MDRLRSRGELLVAHHHNYNRHHRSSPPPQSTQSINNRQQAQQAKEKVLFVSPDHPYHNHQAWSTIPTIPTSITPATTRHTPKLPAKLSWKHHTRVMPMTRSGELDMDDGGNDGDAEDERHEKYDDEYGFNDDQFDDDNYNEDDEEGDDENDDEIVVNSDDDDDDNSTITEEEEENVDENDDDNARMAVDGDVHDGELRIHRVQSWIERDPFKLSHDTLPLTRSNESSSASSSSTSLMMTMTMTRRNTTAGPSSTHSLDNNAMMIATRPRRMSTNTSIQIFKAYEPPLFTQVKVQEPSGATHVLETGNARARQSRMKSTVASATTPARKKRKVDLHFESQPLPIPT